MNEAEVQIFKEKLIKCDKTIHIQQLGVQWIENVEEEKEQKQ